jgi:hypothetical protein
VNNPRTDLVFSDGIAAARTMLALRANTAAIQKRLGPSWELAPYAGDDMRGTSLRRANLLVPFHEVYAAQNRDGTTHGLPQNSYVPCISQARNTDTGELGHVHWFTYTEDPDAVPGKYNDAVLADISRTQTFTKHRRGETEVRESFSAVGANGQLHMTLSYTQERRVAALGDRLRTEPCSSRRARPERAPRLPGSPSAQRRSQRAVEDRPRLGDRRTRRRRTRRRLRRNRRDHCRRDPTALHAARVRT